jgi:hypothetical protein
LSIAQRVGSKLAGKLAARPAEESGREAADMSGFTPIGPELLPNPSFDRGRANWEFYPDPAINAAFSVTLRAGEFDSAPTGGKISSPKSSHFSAAIQFCTGPLVMRNNTWYRLSFKSKATAGFQIPQIKLVSRKLPPGRDDVPAVVLNDAPMITTSWETQTVYFCPSIDATDTFLWIYLGGLPAGATFYIDSLSLKECIQNP